MATTIGLRSISSCSLFRAGKAAAVAVAPSSNSITFRSLSRYQSLLHHRLRGAPSFCSGPNVDAEASAAAAAATTTVAPSESSDDQPKDPIKDAAHMLDIRVGRIIKAWRHEEADSLYVEEVDVGEPEPRTICSGLVKYVPLEQLQDAKVVVLANLKPRNMRGVKSSGMLMAASDASHENVELLVPPEGSVPGERIWFGNVDDKENQPEPATPNQVQKKKVWETVQPHLKTDASCTAMLGEHLMRTSAGAVVSKSLKNANIS
ncbi:hypothetical protein SLA2020_455460 [Shorea laevis]